MDNSVLKVLDSHFNPLHHEGGDFVPSASFFFLYNFNPLHHEGGDSAMARRYDAGCYFNPLHHEGGD